MGVVLITGILLLALLADMTVTGYEVFLHCRRDNDDQVSTFLGCPAGLIIYIGSAAYGYSRSITWNQDRSQCNLGTDVSCLSLTYHHEIMQCNGRRNCSFGRDVLNQTCSPLQHQVTVNFIKINYICIKGVRDCNPSSSGRYYVGNTSVTVSGRTCQAWASQTPHNHPFYNRDDLFPDGRVNNAVNYCRNPGGLDGGLWCYTTYPAVLWEACDVPDCEMNGTATTDTSLTTRTNDEITTSTSSVFATSPNVTTSSNVRSDVLAIEAIVGIVVGVILLIIILSAIIITLICVRRRRSAKSNDASPSDTHDYYNVENINRTNDAVTSPTYQHLQLPSPSDTSLYSQMSPAYER